MADQVKSPVGIEDLPIPRSVPVCRILLVDDFEPWRRSVCSMLRAHEQLRIVGGAVDGLEAVQKAQELRPDLVLLDIGLPNLNGIEAARRIGQVVPDAKILFLSQNNNMDVVRVALKDGVHGYVVKAAAGRELLPAIGTILRGQKFLSSQLNQ